MPISCLQTPRNIRVHTLAVALLTTCLCACVTSPNNGDVLASREASVTFEGLTTAPRRLIWAEAAPSANGPFSAWPGSATRSQLKPSDRVELFLGLSAPVYSWRLQTQIPLNRWNTQTDADGCELAETFVRVRDARNTYRTFDAQGATTPSGVECFEAALMKGSSPLAAYEACGSDTSPVMRLIAGSARYVGDAVIDDESDIAALRCYETIDGSLKVTSTAPAIVALPRLRRVTGALELVYTGTQPTASSFQEERCGAVVTVGTPVRRINLPALTAVGGAVTLRQENSFSTPVSTQAIDLGLNALAEIGSTLAIEIAQFGGSPCGLSTLARVPGDLTLRFLTSGEVGIDSQKLLPVLTETVGRVTIAGAHNVAGTPLAALARAGGLLLERPAGLISGFRLPALTDVTGTVELVGGGLADQPSALLRAGALQIVQSNLISLEQFGGATLALGALTLRENPSLSALSAGDASKVTFSNAAPLTLSANPALDASAICSFVALQRSRGWTGPADLGGVTCP